MPDADPSLKTSATDDLSLITGAAREAGRLAMNFFGRDPRVWNKENNSPVSEADIALDAYLARELLAARPAYGWLSEETSDNIIRLERTRLFVVDPIDGTRAFIAGGEDWTVSIAVVEGGRPIAGALYAPVSDEMYLAVRGGGAWLNGAVIAVSACTDLPGARIAGPRVAKHRDALARAGMDPGDPIRSLALRIALVAAGRRDGAVATAKAHDWDLAAADLLVQEAGGRLSDLDGREICYNQPDIRHPALIAAPPTLGRALGVFVREVIG